MTFLKSFGDTLESMVARAISMEEKMKAWACLVISLLASCGEIAQTFCSAPPASVAADQSPLCGGSTTLSVAGGPLESGASWQWYAESCGGTSVGIGESIEVSPAASTTYYVRAEGDCDPTTCVSATVLVSTLSESPTSASADLNPACEGEPTTLSLTGGSLGSGASWVWYARSCGGISVGTGESLEVSPELSTTYYVRAEGPCNTTDCASIEITTENCAL